MKKIIEGTYVHIRYLPQNATCAKKLLCVLLSWILCCHCVIFNDFFSLKQQFKTDQQQSYRVTLSMPTPSFELSFKHIRREVPSTTRYDRQTKMQIFFDGFWATKRLVANYSVSNFNRLKIEFPFHFRTATRTTAKYNQWAYMTSFKWNTVQSTQEIN